MKSYNLQSLRGHAYDDHEFQADMRESGVYIPDNLLYKPAIGKFVADEMYKLNLQGLPQVDNPITGKPYTESEAKKIADDNRHEAYNLYDSLLKE